MNIEELMSTIKGCTAFGVIGPPSNADPCPLQSLQIGVAILLNKPIILLVVRGRSVPEKLVSVSDRIVEIDSESGTDTAARIEEAMREMGLMV